uniref:Uncharacterized protein n=1 Tax=Panagrolaimus sp. PS1159 TaxID=55785 RepID=A0AC35FFW1_9BILA
MEFKICFNLRLFLLNITIALIIRALLTSYRAFNRIFHALTVTNPCEFTATIYECSFESFLQAIPYAVPFYSFPMIAVERLTATVFRKLYEHFLFRVLVCAGILGNEFLEM